MSCVYEALDVRLSRHVALKVMCSETGDEELAAERLHREAQGAARSEHPAVVTTYGYGCDDELAVSYVAMECLRGETLGQRLERTGPMAFVQVYEIALELLDALAAVHEAAVIHRDLKPSNVFLTTRGRRTDEIKLLDFGVARLIDLHTLTATGELYGTPMYMAPEQLRDASAVDARSDLYSLGMLLHECLSGKPPFARTNLVELTTAIILGRSRDLLRERPDCPALLASFVAQCSHVEPTLRFVSARAATRALEEVMRSP